MNSQKGFVIPLIIAIVAILAIGGGVYVYENKKVEAPAINIPIDDIDQVATTTKNIVGGDKDEHGCLGSAGYSWCAVKNKCLRVWEEKCEASPVSTTTNPVACTMDAMQCPDGSYVGRSGPNCEFVCPEVVAQCLDGGASWYFDKQFISLNDTDLYKNVIAISSSCGETTYKINQSGVFQVVVKSEFDIFLQDYNNGCNDCLVYTSRSMGRNMNYYNYSTGNKIQ